MSTLNHFLKHNNTIMKGIFKYMSLNFKGNWKKAKYKLIIWHNNKINYLRFACSCTSSGIFLQYLFCTVPTCASGRQHPGTGMRMLSTFQLKKKSENKDHFKWTLEMMFLMRWKIYKIMSIVLRMLFNALTLIIILVINKSDSRFTVVQFCMITDRGWHKPKRIYILKIEVKLFSFFSSSCFLKEIENIYSVFLSSYRKQSWKFGRTRKSCGNTRLWFMFPQHFPFSQTSTRVSINW